MTEHVCSPLHFKPKHDATPLGPVVFDNGFHDFLTNTLAANTAADFALHINKYVAMVAYCKLPVGDGVPWYSTRTLVTKG